jgi:hypothetical protein
VECRHWRSTVKGTKATLQQWAFRKKAGGCAHVEGWGQGMWKAVYGELYILYTKQSPRGGGGRQHRP